MNTSQFRLREGATTWQETPDETLLLDLDRASYLGVNHAGSLLWAMLAKGTTRTELIERLSTEYELDTERAGHDVDEFLQQCAERGYLA